MWRQQVGSSAIEASKIAGHSDLEMTGEYSFVTADRQNELTRRIQQQLTEASKQIEASEAKLSAEVPLSSGNGADTPPLATMLIQ